MRLLVIKNVEAPLTSIITSGKAKINGDLMKGKIQISTELKTPLKLDLSLEDVGERVPLFALVPYAFVSGSLSMSVQISNFQGSSSKSGLTRRYPKG